MTESVRREKMMPKSLGDISKTESHVSQMSSMLNAEMESMDPDHISLVTDKSSDITEYDADGYIIEKEPRQGFNVNHDDAELSSDDEEQITLKPVHLLSREESKISSIEELKHATLGFIQPPQSSSSRTRHKAKTKAKSKKRSKSNKSVINSSDQ